MIADDYHEPEAAHSFGSALRDRLVFRFPQLAGWAAFRPAARVGFAVAVLSVAGTTWWLVRPTPPAPIESLLPRVNVAAGAPPTAGTSAAAMSTSASGSVGGIVVHVVGAVDQPGVVQLAPGARVLDAVKAAGGLRPEADLARVNLAAKLSDGQRVLVPAVGEVPLGVVADAGGSSSGSGVAPSVDAPLQLNDATEAQLDALPGVGPATATAIVAHRTAHGPFRSVDALGEVRGIGPAKLEQLRPLVRVTP